MSGIIIYLRYNPSDSLACDLQVAPILQKIVEAYGCSLVEGVFTHEMKQYVIDGNKCILNKPTPEAKVAEDTFEENEVYAVDIVVSTGEGKARLMDEKETMVQHSIRRGLSSLYDLRSCCQCS